MSSILSNGKLFALKYFLTVITITFVASIVIPAQAEKAVESTKNKSEKTMTEKKWQGFIKPDNETLKKILSPLQYKVTQKEGTERPFANEYDSNKAEGIYVDIVSGEPLYSSLDKYDSGTGWPSFTKPLSKTAVVEHEDRSWFGKRTEIRSKIADSHLGHVFTDGPKERGGLRYCMNSASLRFVAKADLEKEGYGEYLELFTK